ncbi:MAG TPA: outer membrane protein assembly factor BamA [Planctomycetota bacterium]
MTLALALCLLVQDPSTLWEGKEIVQTTVTGARRESKVSIENQSGLKKGLTLTKERLDRAYKSLWAMNRFDKIEIRPTVVDGKVQILIHVAEYDVVDKVVFDPKPREIEERKLFQDLRVVTGEPLNPFLLKVDRERLRNMYLDQGHPFSTVEDVLSPSAHGGVVLTWRILEGPRVSVKRIVFSGNASVSDGELRNFMLSKPNPRLWFITTGTEPFVERNLKEDIERIKLYYQLEGWLDIRVGDKVFLKDLEYSDDMTEVTIRIHIDEGRRYSVRTIRFDLDPSGPRVFDPEEMKTWIETKPGAPFTENAASKDVSRIRDRYGERAYIQADIQYEILTSVRTSELDLVFKIKENDKIYVGRLTFEGNTKTKEEVLRREYTRLGFAPGEEFNRRAMDRAGRRIQDRGLVEHGIGVSTRTQEGDDPRTRDVIVDVKEGQTGTVRFAAGYSSSFGILGILELTQRNFDLTDVPESLADVVGGTAFAGGGQFLRIRLAPAASRKSYSIEFREPYFFGYEFGVGTRAYYVSTLRESYDDQRLGATLTVDKRFEPFSFQLTLKAERIDIQNVEDDAPPIVRDIEGRNRVVSLAPALVYDSRDSIIFPSEGFRALLSLEYAGQVLPGSFDFNKLTLETEGHVTLHTTESKLKHVLSYQTVFGWVHGARTTNSVPLIERFYAGGRDSIRGFDYRGMGPHDGDDPIGGEAYAYISAEYSWPLFVEFLRGAVFYDLANLTPRIEELGDNKWRNSVGFGLRFLIPQLGNIPVKLDFGIPLTRESEDERESVTFDIGALF